MLSEKRVVRLPFDSYSPRLLISTSKTQGPQFVSDVFWTSKHALAVRVDLDSWKLQPLDSWVLNLIQLSRILSTQTFPEIQQETNVPPPFIQVQIFYTQNGGLLSYVHPTDFFSYIYFVVNEEIEKKDHSWTLAPKSGKK